MHLVLFFLNTQLYYLTYYYNSGLFMFQMCDKKEKRNCCLQSLSSFSFFTLIKKWNFISKRWQLIQSLFFLVWVNSLVPVKRNPGNRVVPLSNTVALNPWLLEVTCLAQALYCIPEVAGVCGNIAFCSPSSSLCVSVSVNKRGVELICLAK